MIEIKRITLEHRLDVLKYMRDFYQSPAVDHIVEDEILLSTIDAAINDTNNFFGYVILENSDVKGFGFVTKYFSSEVGGYTVQFEDLFIDESLRSKGVGSKYFKKIMDEFKAKRYRLEVTEDNISAIKLYKRLGFEFLEYRQMIKDVNEYDN